MGINGDDNSFPINVTLEELRNHFIDSNNFKTLEEWVSYAYKNRVSFYPTIVKFYMSTKYNKGFCVVFHDAEDLLIEVENKQRAYWIMQDFMIDLSHLKGYHGDELQIIIVPFDSEEEGKLFGESIKDVDMAEYWKDGVPIGSNMDII